MKALTIPKLELQAAVLASRLTVELHHALTMKSDRTLIMWTENTTVLQWLHSSEKQPVFVANRVEQIFDLTTIDEWNHFQSTDIPADVSTRSVATSALLDSSWLKGSDFLHHQIGLSSYLMKL